MRESWKAYIKAVLGLGCFHALFIEISWVGILIGCGFWALMLAPMLTVKD